MMTAIIAMAQCPGRGLLCDQISRIELFLAEPRQQNPAGTGALDLILDLRDDNALTVGTNRWRNQRQDAPTHDGHETTATAAKQFGPLSLGN